MNSKLLIAIFCIASGFLIPLGVLFLILYLWEDGVKSAIKKEEEQTYINGFDSKIISELK